MKKYELFLSSWETVIYRDILWSEFIAISDNPAIVEGCIVEGAIKTPEDYEDLTRAIFSSISDQKTAKKGKWKLEPHLIEGYMMHYYHQSYETIQSLPVRKIMEWVRDLWIVTGHEEYDPDRFSEKPDKKGLKSVLGKTQGAVKG